MDEKPKILIADDEEHILRLMEHILLPLGYRVYLAHDGKEAIDMARVVLPDVILSDIMMPKLSGYEVVKALKDDDATRTIPVIIISAARDRENRLKALENGADEFLAKPVDKLEMTTRIKSLLKVKAYNDHLLADKRELEAEVAQRTDQLRQTLAKLRGASLEAIFRLSRAAEYRDRGTGCHIKRMSHIAAAIARRMGLPGRTAEAILYASPMHDVGKIGIPDNILLKPGPLDPDEWVTMRQHTTIGARILEGSNSGFIRLGAVVAGTHHERWDGSGYPRGLAGRAIPLAGRIVAVADVFDALISDRPYRKTPSTVDQACATLLAERGSHFDPEVADTFLAMRAEVQDIREQFGDDDCSYSDSVFEP